jgi:hypothetical protein
MEALPPIVIWLLLNLPASHAEVAFSREHTVFNVLAVDHTAGETLKGNYIQFYTAVIYLTPSMMTLMTLSFPCFTNSNAFSASSKGNRFVINRFTSILPEAIN